MSADTRGGSQEWASSTWPEVEALARQPFVAFLPVGSTEAHGPHLPLTTDGIIAEGAAARAAEILAERDLPSRCLPTIPYAVTDCAAEFPGTVSVSDGAVRGMIRDVAVSLARQGARVICLVTAHLEPAHRKCLENAVSDGAEEGANVIFPDCVRKPYVLRLGDEFKSGACHAGSFESSLVMALRPEWVRDEVRKSLPEFPVSLGKALHEGKKTFKEAGGEQAYFGNPAAASAEEGRQLLEELAKMLVEEVEKHW